MKKENKKIKSKDTVISDTVVKRLALGIFSIMTSCSGSSKLNGSKGTKKQ